MSYLHVLTAILSPHTEPDWDYTPGEEWNSSRHYPAGCVVTYNGRRYVSTKPDQHKLAPGSDCGARKGDWWRIDRYTFPVEARPYCADEPREVRVFNRPRGRVLAGSGG